MTILDVKAVYEKGIWYDIEIQIAEQGFYDKYNRWKLDNVIFTIYVLTHSE